MIDSLQNSPIFWIATALAIGFIASIIGGAVGGIFTGGKALGNELAAMMGSLYGPLAGVSGVALALVILAIAG